MSQPQVHISEHAVLRYLERVLEIDVFALRQKLAREIATAAATGARKYTTGGAVFVFDVNPAGTITVVTVLTKQMRKQPRSARPKSKSVAPRGKV